MATTAVTAIFYPETDGMPLPDGDFYGKPLVGERLVDGEYRRVEIRGEGNGRV